MGCNIHLWVEFRRGDEWKFAHDWREDAEPEDRGPYDPPYRQLDYRYLFGILANVRNQDGRVTPISLPRGVPKDISREGSLLVEQWIADGHAHSFLSAAELLSHDWTKSVYIEDGEPTPGKTWYQERELCQEFVDVFLPSLASYGPPDEVRIVFFFDN